MIFKKLVKLFKQIIFDFRATIMMHIRSYKESANSAIHSGNDEIFILVPTNIPIEISATSSMLSKKQLQYKYLD